MPLLLLLFLLCGCTSYQPFWQQSGCIADEDKIRMHYAATISPPCLKDSRGCAKVDCKARTADLYVRDDARNRECVIVHERQHARGWTHAAGADDC